MSISISLTEQSSNESTSLNESKKDISDGEKINEIYFIILYTRNEKENSKDFVFTKYESEPQKIYSKEIPVKNGTYLYEKVFKLKRKKKKKEESKKHGDSKASEESKKKKGSKKEDENKKIEESKTKDKKRNIKVKTLKKMMMKLKYNFKLEIKIII